MRKIPHILLRLLIYFVRTFLFIKKIPTPNTPIIAIPISIYFTASAAPNGGTIAILSDCAVSGSPKL